MKNRIELITDKIASLHSQKKATSGQKKEKLHNKSNLISTAAYPDITGDTFFQDMDMEELKTVTRVIEQAYKSAQNRYEKVRAAVLSSRIYGYYMPDAGPLLNIGTIPYPAVKALDNQQFDKALFELYKSIDSTGRIPEAVMKMLGIVYRSKAFSIIEEQVRECFTARHPELFSLKTLEDYGIRCPEYFKDTCELVSIPVRIEHTSCVGSDIFYLSMTRPEKARCINYSVNLFDPSQKKMVPPINVIVRPIRENGIRLTSVDLDCSKLVTSLDELFNIRNDDLSLLKSAVIVSGIIPPSFKNCEDKLTLTGIIRKFMEKNEPYMGFEVISNVIDIPRGSGLAVSTNLLAALILALMRFSGQIPCNKDKIGIKDKMDVAARCIYGEWLGGSGGGWQDCGGMWAGIKQITAQPADPALDPDSAGSLLPLYKELDIPHETVERLLSSMVLVNGGTGQDVGPVLRMITENYILKEKTSWDARLRTENRYDKILKALLKGNIKELGKLESEDFEDRRLISPLSDNLYHQKVYAQLKSRFKDDLWGYDSTGGRAGAGGIFFVNPCIREEFENAFISVCLEMQEAMQGQMHFSSKPLVYRFELNKEGIKVEPYSKNGIDAIVDNLFKRPRSETPKDLNLPDINGIKASCTFDNHAFLSLQSQYREGKLSISNNIYARAEEIGSIAQASNLFTLPSIDSKEYENLFYEGIELLKEPMAYIILNGGESTRYGVNTIRGLNPVFYMSGSYYSMIELKLRHLSFLAEKYSSPVYPVLVNSFFTDRHTMRLLRLNNFYGIKDKDVYNCVHQVSHRIYPKESDLVYWYEVLREKGLTEKEEQLTIQYMESMKDWIGKKGAGNIYEPEGRNKLYTLVSPGHYYSFMSIVTSHTLGKLLERGVKRLLVSSNDNLLSTVDPAILAFHIKMASGTTAEVVPRMYDKGGAPVCVNGKVVILEDFSFPDQDTLWKTPFFNPITTWIETESLIELLELKETDLIDASRGSEEKRAKCIKAVENLANRLKTYVVLKHVSEDMGKGIAYTYPVIQFEKLYGDLVGLLNPRFLLVPKALRHTQVKSVDHVYQVYVDRALDVLKPQIKL